MEWGKTFIVPYLHNRDKTLLDSIYYPPWKYLCTIVSFSEASFLINILQGIRVSSFKLKKIFYESDIPPVRNPVYSQYDGQTIDAIIIDDTKSKRRTGGRPSIKGALGLDLGTGEEFLLYLGAVKSCSEVLSYINGNYNISDEIYAICDGDDNLQQHLEDCGYRIRAVYESFCQNIDVLSVERAISKRGANEDQKRDKRDNFYVEELGEKAQNRS
jgi:hypothetical protein